ncbi:MAG: flagellar hook assembly protein FlgD [Thermodesulfobacteriota bacterium]
MAVAQTSSGIPTYTPPSANPPVGKKELERDDFMKLFITQLQYQDPFKPMDSYQVASQLAQFSSLEATLKMSGNMEKLLDYQMSQNNMQLLNLLNSEVVASGDALFVKDGQAGATEFELDLPAETCDVSIYDATGHLLDKVTLKSLNAGAHPFEWDGKDLAGRTVADGSYIYKVEAMSVLGDPVKVTTRTTGTVTGLAFNDGTAELTIEGMVPITAADVVSVVRTKQQ